MVKYNYKGAAALWDEYDATCISDMSFGGIEKQQERRYFMRAMVRNIPEDKKMYVDVIRSNIEDARPVADAKSRMYDFDYEREQEQIIQKIIDFEGVAL